MSTHRKSLDDRARMRLGSTIHEKYRLERLLGVGGMAAVYAGSHRNGNRVAVKVLHPELGVDPEVRGRFLREGYVANKVDHPGAVRVLDDDVTGDGAAFLVMELLEGEEVDARWRRLGRRMGVEEVCAIVRRLLEVLAAAHAQSVVHCDIKPENLFITVDGGVKVLDFGIARLRERGASSLTGTGRTMGTPAYMPPEQARGRRSEIDGRTDLWATGATMFTLLSGDYAHQAAETTEEMLVFTATQPVRALAEVAPEVPAPIAAVVDRALAFSKAARWPGAFEMRAALEEAFLAAYGVPLEDVRLTATPSPRGTQEAVTADESKRTIPRAGPDSLGGEEWGRATRTGPGPEETQPASVFQPSSPPAGASSPLAGASSLVAEASARGRLANDSASGPPARAPVKASTTAGFSRHRSAGERRGARRATIAAWAAAATLLGAGGLAVARYSARASVSAPRASLASSPAYATPDSAVGANRPLDQEESPVAAATVTAVPIAPATGAPSAGADHAARGGATPSSPRAHGGDRPLRPTQPLAGSSSTPGEDCPLESYVETVKGEPVTRFRRACR